VDGLGTLADRDSSRYAAMARRVTEAGYGAARAA
jgi:hypothetical protein